MSHTSEFGSQIAKNGFQNELDIIKKFLKWKEDEDAQKWLSIMGYSLNEIERVEAFKIREVIKEYNKINMQIETMNPKSDIQVQIKVFLKNIVDPQNISIKLVTSTSGFNQIDKRWINKYKELWKIPETIVSTLKLYTGENLPEIEETRDIRRMFFDEIEKKRVDELIRFFSLNKVMIICDILKGRGKLSAEWMLVSKKIDTNSSKWIFKSINEVINHYSKGDVVVTNRGNLKIGGITMQRKGGDAGRETAKMLQFKFDPLELF